MIDTEIWGWLLFRWFRRVYRGRGEEGLRTEGLPNLKGFGVEQEE